MKKISYIILGMAVIILAVVITMVNQTAQEIKKAIPTDDNEPSPYNATYIIDDSPVALVSGKAEEAINDSSSKKITTVFDAQKKADVNADGKDDVVVILTQTNGGSGTFYYAAVALGTDAGYDGTTAVLLGDRIAPQTIDIHDSIIAVNYADHKEGAPMTDQPTEDITKYLKVSGKTLVPFFSSNPMIHVGVPSAFQTIASPLTVSGEARGSWYFEASFPVQVLDMNGNVLASTPAQAQGDWMTDNFVPFTATLSFTGVSGQNGTVVFKKDNPSGLPQNEGSVSIPIKFQ